MIGLGVYTLLAYLAGAFTLHAVLHWVYEDSDKMSSADYVCMTFFLYLGVFILYTYHLPECYQPGGGNASLCWMSAASGIKP